MVEKSSLDMRSAEVTEDQTEYTDMVVTRKESPIEESETVAQEHIETSTTPVLVVSRPDLADSRLSVHEEGSGNEVGISDSAIGTIISHSGQIINATQTLFSICGENSSRETDTFVGRVDSIVHGNVSDVINTFERSSGRETYVEHEHQTRECSVPSIAVSDYDKMNAITDFGEPKIKLSKEVSSDVEIISTKPSCSLRLDSSSHPTTSTGNPNTSKAQNYYIDLVQSGKLPENQLTVSSNSSGPIGPTSSVISKGKNYQKNANKAFRVAVRQVMKKLQESKLDPTVRSSAENKDPSSSNQQPVQHLIKRTVLDRGCRPHSSTDNEEDGSRPALTTTQNQTSSVLGKLTSGLSRLVMVSPEAHQRDANEEQRVKSGNSETRSLRSSDCPGTEVQQQGWLRQHTVFPASVDTYSVNRDSLRLTQYRDTASSPIDINVSIVPECDIVPQFDIEPQCDIVPEPKTIGWLPANRNPQELGQSMSSHVIQLSTDLPRPSSSVDEEVAAAFSGDVDGDLYRPSCSWQFAAHPQSSHTTPSLINHPHASRDSTIIDSSAGSRVSSILNPRRQQDTQETALLEYQNIGLASIFDSPRVPVETQDPNNNEVPIRRRRSRSNGHLAPAEVREQLLPQNIDPNNVLHPAALDILDPAVGEVRPNVVPMVLGALPPDLLAQIREAPRNVALRHHPRLPGSPPVEAFPPPAVPLPGQRRPVAAAVLLQVVNLGNEIGPEPPRRLQPSPTSPSTSRNRQYRRPSSANR